MEQSKNNPFWGMCDVGQAEQTFNLFRMNHSENEDGQQKMLNDLLDALLNSGNQAIGDADAFHNFAVTISKVTSDNKNAYAIVKKGLELYEFNSDLLADALMYGYSAGEHEACKQHYETLTQLDKSQWTWRAFSFSITYLLDVADQKTENYEKIIALAEEYKKHLAHREDPWLSLFRVYDRINQRDKGIAVLEEALEKFKSCPKCRLRYADIMVDAGEYNKAIPVIIKMLRDPNSPESINASYMYFLDGKCRLAKLMESDKYYAGEIDEHDIQMIYRAFHLARKSEGLRESTNQQIEGYINRLEIETGIAYKG